MKKILISTIAALGAGGWTTPALAECAAGNLITPAVPVAREFDPGEIYYGSIPIRHTFAKNRATACIDQEMTAKSARQGMLWVRYRSELGEHTAVVVESEWRRVTDAPGAASDFATRPSKTEEK